MHASLVYYVARKIGFLNWLKYSFIAVPPHSNQLRPPLVMHELGTAFTIPCGISLGPLSLSRNYTVTWQRYTNSSTHFERVGKCQHISGGEEDSPADKCITPKYRINLRDFSLTVYNFSISTLNINLTEPKVVYKCRVQQQFSGNLDETVTDVAFSYSKKFNSMCITSTNMVRMSLIVEAALWLPVWYVYVDMF